MDAPRSRTTTVFLALGFAFMAAIFLGFVLLVWRSDGAIWLKVLGSVGLVAVVIMGTIRLTIASRPYGDPKN
jgi:predicted permease